MSNTVGGNKSDGGTATSCRLQLHLSAKNLKNFGGFFSGRSDPFAVVTVRGDNPNNKPHVVGQTDVVFNNLNPSWSKVIFIEGYKFGVPLYFEVGVFDFDATQTGKSEQELSRMDAFSQSVITSNAASRALMRGGNFPHQVMGTALFEVGQVLGARGNVASKSLQSGGAAYVHIEKCTTDSGDVGKLLLQLRAIKLVNCQSLGRTSSPYYELYRKVDRPTGSTWISVYRSNAVRCDLNPIWNTITLDLEATCNSDLDRAMKIIIWDHRKTGKHKQMGEFETTIRFLIEACTENPNNNNNNDVDTGEQAATDTTGFTVMKNEKEVGIVEVLEATLTEMPNNRSRDYNTTNNKNTASNDSNQMKSSGKDGRRSSGSHGGDGGANMGQEKARVNNTNNHNNGAKLESTNISADNDAQQQQHHQQQQRPEFVDYLSGGCQISLAVAIDFTASNGDPRQVGTPHYFHPPESKEWNDYEKAIFAVGSILAKYDSDQKFPVWGFGAKYNNIVRHCFQCGNDVEVDGVQGIMDAYRGVFRTPLTMSYPTKLTEIIQTAAAYARHEAESSQEEGQLSYTILLILTAGNVENVEETKQTLIEASDDPLSCVIVGIGDADFSAMEFLDEHDPNKEGGRDITKFVRFSDYKSFNALTEAVLDEIPNQLVTYFYNNEMMPGKLENYNDEDVMIEPADDDSRTYTFLG